MSDHDDSQQAWALARCQHWVLSGAQLCALGFTRHAIAHRVDRGRLQRIWEGVFVVGRRAIEREQLWMGAVLAGGTGAMLSHSSAAASWGISPAAGIRPVHITVPTTRRMRVDGIVAHRRRTLPRRRYKGALPLTSPLFTLLDLAETLPDRQLEAALNEADKRSLVHPDDVEMLVTLRRTPAITRVVEMLAGHSPTDSDLERVFLRLVEQAGLPRPRTQARVHGYRVDFFWPDLKLVVETDGLTYHRTAAQQAKDRRRDQRLTAAGLTCIRFTNAQIRREGDEVAAILGQVARRMRA